LCVTALTPGCSRWQGVHHDAQKRTTTTDPLQALSESRWPWREVPASAGATSPTCAPTVGVAAAPGGAVAQAPSRQATTTQAQRRRRPAKTKVGAGQPPSNAVAAQSAKTAARYTSE
jgi:hypothetical protein